MHAFTNKVSNYSGSEIWCAYSGKFSTGDWRVRLLRPGQISAWVVDIDAIMAADGRIINGKVGWWKLRGVSSKYWIANDNNDDENLIVKSSGGGIGNEVVFLEDWLKKNPSKGKYSDYVNEWNLIMDGASPIKP